MDRTITIEQWRDIAGFENIYQISCCGRVRRICGGNNTFVGKQIKPIPNNNGYLGVTLYNNGFKSIHRIHKLIMDAFVPDKPHGSEICHNDGDKNNNNLANLRYDTHANNMKDKMMHGHHFQPDNRGEKCGASKLKRIDVLVIRRLLIEGVRTQKEIAAMFNVQRKVVSDIKTGKTWRCIE